jgi:hypothetical protein
VGVQVPPSAPHNIKGLADSELTSFFVGKGGLVNVLVNAKAINFFLDTELIRLRRRPRALPVDECVSGVCPSREARYHCFGGFRHWRITLRSLGACAPKRFGAQGRRRVFLWRYHGLSPWGSISKHKKIPLCFFRRISLRFSAHSLQKKKATGVCPMAFKSDHHLDGSLT